MVAANTALRRRLGLLDLSLITVGSIVGSGIFRSPSVVAARAHAPLLILGAWACGGAIALCGAWICAELADRRPSEGGFYAYLRDAFHPMLAFIFGWLYLCGIDTGAVAASGVTFANYFEPLTGLTLAPSLVASAVIAFFTIVNCFGVRQGGTTQNVLAIAKVAGIAMLVGIGFFAHPAASHAQTSVPFPTSTSALGAFGLAMVPVFFAYNGFLSATYVTGEAKDPRRTVARGVIAGVCIVIPMYVAVNVVCLRVLGPQALALTQTPAADVMRAALGSVGARAITVIVALSTLGFISTKMLVTPRLYHRMALDGLFFERVAWVHPRTGAPVFAIAIQGAVAIVIAVTGTFDSIVNYIVSLDYVFVALAAVALVIFRRRDAKTAERGPLLRTPGYPFTAALFFFAVTAVVLDVFISYPENTMVCAGVAIAGALAYFIRQRFSTSRPAATLR